MTVKSSKPVLENLTITQNFSYNKGGGLHLENADAILKNVIVHTNLSLDIGGGISIVNSKEPKLSNILIHHNNSFKGAGIYIENSSPKIYHLTAAKNYAWEEGFGIFLAEASHLVVANSIIWSFHDNSIAMDPDSKLNITSSLYKMDSFVSSGGNLNQDPLLWILRREIFA